MDVGVAEPVLEGPMAQPFLQPLGPIQHPLEPGPLLLQECDEAFAGRRYHGRCCGELHHAAHDRGRRQGERLGRQAPAVPVGEVAVVDGLQGRAERAPLVGGQPIADRVASRHERVQDETATVVQLVPERGRLRPNRREDVGDAGVQQRAWHLQVRLADRLAVDLEEPATSWPGCLVRGRARVISGDERERGCLDAICGQPRGCQFGVVEAGSSSMRHLSLGGRWRALQIGSRCRQ